MIEVDFVQQENRIVRVQTVTAGPGGRCRNTLSGFLVAEGLVLTCAHDVLGAESIRVGRESTDERSEAEIVWPLRDQDDADTELVDVALLRVEGLKTPKGQRLIWGGFAGFVGAADAYCMGYPRVARDIEQYHLTPVTGSFFPGEGATRNRMVFTVASALPAEADDWAGMSGAMVRDANGYMLGIAAELPEAWHGRYFVVPAELILAQPRLKSLLGDPELHAISSEHPLLKPAFEPMGEETDFKLITARYGQVPFVAESHGDTLDDLVEWCEDSDRPAAVRILLGPGGSGKTRVAAELCRRLQESELHWTAGFAREDESSTWDSFNPQHPTLVVFDYVERPTIAGKVAALLSRLDRLGPRLQARVRILLVSRSTANWYAQVDDVGRGVLSRRLRAEGEKSNVLLADRPFDPAIRRLHFSAAYERFSSGAQDADEYFESIEDAQYDSPLLIHIAALLAARGDGIPFAGPNRLRETLLDFLISKERSQSWKREPGLSTTIVGPELSDQALHAVAIMTMTTPTVVEAEALLKCSRLWEDQPNAVRREAVRAAMRLYPGQKPGDGLARRAAPIEPDLVSEHLLMNIEDLGQLLERIQEAGLTTHHNTRLLHILSLSCDHYAGAKSHFLQALQHAVSWATGPGPLAPEAEELMADLLGQSLGLLLDTAVKQANEDDDVRVALTLTKALKGVAGVRSVEATVANIEFEQCRGHSSLLGLREALYRLAVEHCRRVHEDRSLLNCLEGWLDTKLELGELDSTVEIFEETQGLRGGANGTADLGRLDRMIELLIRNHIWDQANRVFGMALDLRRGLGESEVGLHGWGLPLAETIQRGCLGEGMVDEAFSLANWSIDMHSRFPATAHPSYDSTVDEMKSLSQRYLDGDKPRKALEVSATAIRFLNRLSNEYLPGHTSILRMAEAALDRLWAGDDTGDLVGNERLLKEVWRKLADIDEKHLPAYADALERGGSLLLKSGETDTAIRWLMEAGELRWQFRISGDEVSGLRLVASLEELRTVPGLSGEELLNILTELVRAYRMLAAENDRFKMGEVVALERLDMHRWRSEITLNPRELTGIAEAARIRRQRSMQGMEDFGLLDFEYKAWSTKPERIGNRQTDLTIVERLPVLREIARQLPEAEPLLAFTLTERAKNLEGGDQDFKALRLAEESRKIHQRISGDATSPYMKQRLETEGLFCRLAARSAPSRRDAESAAKRAVKAARKLARSNPAFRPVLGQALLDQCALLWERGWAMDAIAKFNEAADVYLSLAQNDRSQLNIAVNGLVSFAGHLRSIVAIAHMAELIAGFRRLAGEEPEYVPALLEILRKAAGMRREAGATRRAVELEQEAAAIEAMLPASDQTE